MPKHKKQSYWRLVGRQFRKNKLAVLALFVLALLFLVALGAPFVAGNVPVYMVKDGRAYWFPNVIEYKSLVSVDFDLWTPGPGETVVRPPIPHDPQYQDLMSDLQPPDKDHWLGTDNNGRDVLSRMVWGTRIAMSVGFIAVGISLVIGIFFGALSGYYGRWVDAVVLRIIEVMMCFPTMILILSVNAFLRPSIINIMILIGITGWTGVARLVRGEFLKLRDSDFAVAARATGLTDSRIMYRHILPNALSPVLVSATFGIAGAILTESALSFIGFGVPPGTPSWGELLSQSQRYLSRAWWLVVFPGAAIFITVTAFNLVGEALRDAMDPRLRI